MKHGQSVGEQFNFTSGQRRRPPPPPPPQSVSVSLDCASERASVARLFEWWEAAMIAASLVRLERHSLRGLSLSFTTTAKVALPNKQRCCCCCCCRSSNWNSSQGGGDYSARPERRWAALLVAWSSLLLLLLLLQLSYKRANGGGGGAVVVVLCLDSGPLGASAAECTAGCMFCCISSHFGNTLVSCSCSFCCRRCRCCCPQVPFGTLLHPTSSLFALPATLLFFPVELSQTLWDVVVAMVVVCLAKCVCLPALSQCLWPCSSSSSSCRWSTEGTPRLKARKASWLTDWWFVESGGNRFWICCCCCC